LYHNPPGHFKSKQSIQNCTWAAKTGGKTDTSRS
jgi:hypothetical protein